jgi:DNA-binding beta-propeller fold protein YncE
MKRCIPALLLMLLVGLATASAQTDFLTVLTVPHVLAMGVNPLTARLYAGGGDSLTIINTDTNAILSGVNGVNSVFNLAVDPKLFRVYLPSHSANRVDVLSEITGQIVTTIPTTGIPHDVAVNPTDNRLYISELNTGDVIVVDGNTLQVVTTIDAGDSVTELAINTFTNRLYALETTTFSVKVIDTLANTLVGSIPVAPNPAVNPTEIDINPFTNQLFAVYGFADFTGSLWRIDLDSGVVTGSWDFPYSANALVVNAVVNLVYVVAVSDQPNSGFMLVYDGASGVRQGSILNLGGTPYDVTVNPLTGRVYAANYIGTSAGTSANRVRVYRGQGPDMNQSPIRNFWLEPPTLAWSSVSNATGYEIQVDNNAAFTSPEYQNNTLGAGDLQVTTPEIPDGLYYWRVRAKQANGVWGLWSAVDTMVVDD